MKDTSQSGRSMLEMLAVIMLMGMLTLGALAGYTQATKKYNSSKLFNDINYISEEVLSLYSWQRSYPNNPNGLPIANLCNNRVFPEDCVNGYAPKNAFGGSYNISSTLATLTIQASGIPETECLLLGEKWHEEGLADANTSGCAAGNIAVTFN